MKRSARWLLAATLGFGLQAMAQDDVLLLNAQRENHTCVVPRGTATNCPSGTTRDGYFVQGHRVELQVFNRKFLTDYSISIDGVTQLQTGPNIRNLNEAENLTLGAASFVTIPPSKGGAEGLTPRTADSILLELVNETTATKPRTDLDADHEAIERERAKIQAQQRDFAETLVLLRGDVNVPRDRITLGAALGSPDVYRISVSLENQFHELTSPPFWNDPAPYQDEQKFRNVNTRVQDLIAAVKTLGAQLSAADLQTKLTSLTTAIAQYENDVNIFRGNAQAALDAAALAEKVNDNLRGQLRREEMKALLLDKLKGPDSKPVLDEAEMNELLKQFEGFFSVSRAFIIDRSKSLETGGGEYLHATEGYATAFQSGLQRDRSNLQVELPDAIAKLNAGQGRLLNRVNEIYDRSAVPEPLPKQIDLKGHSGNLVVYYTIRRIETFQRYTVAQVQGPSGSAPANTQGVALPPSKGSAPSGAPAAQPNAAATAAGAAAATPGTAAVPADNANSTAANATPGSGTDTNQGIVVAKGTFEVHDVYHANVAAAVAFSTLKDESVATLPQPQFCSGTPGSPDANCFSPQVSRSFKWTPIVGLDYYFRPRDTFPRAAGQRWFCREHPWQCFGVMGAASVTKANSYFAGAFFEPALGVQFGTGANFGIKTVLQSPYKNGVPVDITGSFPTTDKRGTGGFVSAGLDLGIFRKIFGKLTGIGTSASGTSGK